MYDEWTVLERFDDSSHYCGLYRCIKATNQWHILWV